MFKNLFKKAKEQGKNAVQAVRQNVEQTGKSYAQQQRDNMIRQANVANHKKYYYGKRRR